ncbi:MAG: hypothetical protein QW390_00510 [Candidatus Bathyarchaeia archaeon]
MSQTSVQVSRTKGLYYTLSHLWVRIGDDLTSEIGLSKYACRLLTELAKSSFLLFYPDPIEHVGVKVRIGQRLGLIETKSSAAFPVISPLTGVVTGINVEALDRAYAICEKLESVWLVKIKPTNLDEEALTLLTPEQYERVCEALKMPVDSI